MPLVNQAGEEVEENTLIAYGVCYESLTDSQRDDAIALILSHLHMKLVSTNATKHGNRELILRGEDQ